MVKRLYQADSKETFIKRDEYAFSNEALRLIPVRNNEVRNSPITLPLNVGKQSKVVEIEYYGGLRFPHLKPISKQEDQLEVILAPRASRSATNTASDLPLDTTGATHR